MKKNLEDIRIYRHSYPQGKGQDGKFIGRGRIRALRGGY
jgi:hypothetical protein